MKIIGTLCIVTAAILLFAANNHNSDAGGLEKQISEQAGLSKLLGEGFKFNDFDRLRIQAMRETAHKFFGGATIFALVGLWLVGSTRSTVKANP